MRSILFVVALVMIQSVAAWNWDAHEAMVMSVYYRLDPALREHLSVERLAEGSIMPDKVFRDYQKHGFPRSLPEAERWLQSTHSFLAQEDYSNASLSFGIASHYLTDSFSAPHSISGEPYSLHQLYEDQASQAYDYAECPLNSFALAEAIMTGTEQGKTWGSWVATRDAALPRHAVHDATLSLTTVASDVFNSTCTSFETTIRKVDSSFTPQLYLGMGIVLLCVVGVGAWLYRDLEQYRK